MRVGRPTSQVPSPSPSESASPAGGADAAAPSTAPLLSPEPAPVRAESRPAVGDGWLGRLVHSGRCAATAAAMLGVVFTSACTTTQPAVAFGGARGAPLAGAVEPGAALPRSARPLSVALPSGSKGLDAASAREVVDGAGVRRAFSFRAPAKIDADGGHDSLGDPHYQKTTSLRWSSADPLSGRPYANALEIPYFVLPTSAFHGKLAKPGDFARLRYQGRELYAVLGDFGPNDKVGEISVFAAQKLGIPSSPVNGGVSSKSVEYTVLPGSGRGVHGGPPLTNSTIQSRGAAAFRAATSAGWVTR